MINRFYYNIADLHVLYNLYYTSMHIFHAKSFFLNLIYVLRLLKETVLQSFIYGTFCLSKMSTSSNQTLKQNVQPYLTRLSLANY
jgi:hypothetical protein